MGVSIEGDEEVIRFKIPVRAVNMQRAIDFIEYLKSEHISKIMLYAQSRNGKLSTSEVVLNAITRLSDSKDIEKIDHRTIIGRLSKSQRMNVEKLKPILQQLISEQKIGRNDDNSYFILS